MSDVLQSWLLLTGPNINEAIMVKTIVHEILLLAEAATHISILTNCFEASPPFVMTSCCLRVGAVCLASLLVVREILSSNDSLEMGCS